MIRAFRSRTPRGVHRPLRRYEEMPEHVSADGPIRTPSRHRVEVDRRLFIGRRSAERKA
jgi:hypothetical protein